MAELVLQTGVTCFFDIGKRVEALFRCVVAKGGHNLY